MKGCITIIIWGIIFFVSGCDKPPVDVKNSLSVNPNELIFSAGGSDRMIVSVSTDAADWLAEPSESWITIGPTKDRFVVAAGANPNFEDRYGSIKVTAGNADTAIINITQLAAEDTTPTLSVDTEELWFTSVNIQTNTVYVTASYIDSWDVTTSEEWIIIHADKELNTLSVTVDRNWQSEARTGTIIVEAYQLDPIIITVHQQPYVATNWASDPALQELRAFPGAEGYGAYTTGGRNGKIIYVTNLEDSGEGSLRWAINQKGPRIIMFKVSGNIRLKDRINISEDHVTIAGHTAPGEGICLADNFMNIKASNVIIRYMRFRMGDLYGIENDALWGRYESNIIIDHCSMSWSTDECASFYDNQNFTLQWSILSESLRYSAHFKGAHGYGGIWGGKRASFHHNLLAHHDSRNPRFAGYTYQGEDRKTAGMVDFRNNVIYNWGLNSGYGGEGGRYNMINNYYQPSSTSGRNSQIVGPGPDAESGIYGTFHLAGNVMMLPGGGVNKEVTDDNWKGFNSSGGADTKTDIEFEKELLDNNTTTHTAYEAYDLVLEHAGASYRRDEIDTRVVSEVRNLQTPIRASSEQNTRPGHIDSQEDVGGWCDLISLTPPTDSDGDGIPDEWEIANGLNPNDPSDGKKTTLTGGTYNNVEVYLYDLLKK